MRKLLGSALVVAALVAVPAVAAAQGQSAARQEFGVDLAFTYVSPDQLDGFFTVGTPVDLRVGFLSGPKMTIEPRVSLFYTSDITGGGGGDGGYDFGLGLNLTYGMSPGGNRSGLYLTGGASVELVDFGGGTSGSIIGFNAGIGTRSAAGNSAFRPEAFFRYDLENTDLLFPNTMSFGLRLGMSLWR